MTAILTLCVLSSSVPDTLSWQPFSPCVYCLPVYLILCHDSHSHLVCITVLSSSVPDTVSWQPFSPCVYNCIVFQCTWYCVMSHSHLVYVGFQCTWYSVITAFLTLCALCSRTQCWRRSMEMSFTSTPRNLYAALWHPSEHTVFTLCDQTIKFCFCGECSPCVLIITAVMCYGEYNYPVWLSSMHFTETQTTWNNVL